MMDNVSSSEEDEVRELEDAVEAHPQDPTLRFRLGELLWGRGDPHSKEKAAENFVICAKLNPQNGAAFRYLGHYYYYESSSSDDDSNPHKRDRAFKCYERAVKLDPNDSVSGEALCDMLDAGGKETLEVSICTEASLKSARAFWAFRRLGFLHVHRHNFSQAVPSLQHAIPGYPTSPHLWEALGLAYHRLGMFSAATKSYGRAIELDPTRVFSLIQCGNIFLMLGSFRKGAEQFRQALEISPHNVSANYGLASALLGLSKECLNLGAFRWGASLLEDACKVADANTRLAGNVSCNWKLLGDIQVAYAKCLPWMEDDQRMKVVPEAFHSSILSWKQTCRTAVMSARKSYQRALHLTPWQANLYIDIAITADLISSMDENYGHDLNHWQLPEKMALGALLLEGVNYDFWTALGCLSGHNALKQHALIRGLQLDVSSAIAWAYLGKFYREKGEIKLSRQAFDCARSIDPSLALSWAGMSAIIESRESTLDEAFESCLRAVQILPLAEFQIGLAKLAFISGNLASSQVFGAIRQAVHRAPHYPESHNLNGLVCEARSDYQAAITSYQLARSAINISSGDATNSHLQDITVNLARALSKAGYAADAVQECENLKKEGMLDVEGMQIYAFSLWKLGKNDLALSVVRSLAASVSKMERTSAAASVSFICRQLYYISGLDSAIASILKMPEELLRSSKVFFVVLAIHALDQANRLESAVSRSRGSILSSEHLIEMHYLIVFAKLVKYGSEYCPGFQSGISHLRRVIHMFPNSNLLRNLLGHLLLSSGEWKNTHIASRCCILGASYGSGKEGLKSGVHILGAGAVACYATGNKNPKFSFPTCGYQCLDGPEAVQELQKYDTCIENHGTMMRCICLYLIFYKRHAKRDSLDKFELPLSALFLLHFVMIYILEKAVLINIKNFSFCFALLKSVCKLGIKLVASSATCMELARQLCSSEILSQAQRSLNKAHLNSAIPLPFVSLLSAQAEGSLGSKSRWVKKLRNEWYSWPPGIL
ncbi:hypothetical protein Tsubulata_037363 [Turnera subulata]|uniref:Uncharacterized protein n=1 Tax=Turnera subulata TaxID=218843 RepID=A0A9Q0JCU5_9ROSI|nr:hypothetical protein Tsubulata_037363 [Turnera subulata]